MPQRDVYHQVVRNALVRDVWVITDDPLLLSFGRRNVYVDLGAEFPFAAEKDGQKIAVDIKSFTGASEMRDLEAALGQYALYRFILDHESPERSLWLAVPMDAYERLFEEPEVARLIDALDIHLLTFDAETEVVTQWFP